VVLQQKVSIKELGLFFGFFLGRGFTIGQAAQRAPQKTTDPALAGSVRTRCPRTHNWCLFLGGASFTRSPVLSCLIHATGWADAPRWGKGRSSPDHPNKKVMRCEVFATCLINAEPCRPSTTAREGAGLWLEGPGSGRGVRKPK
jgi:hypothetical protein